MFKRTSILRYKGVVNLTAGVANAVEGLNHAVSSIIAIGALVQIAPPEALGGELARPDAWIRYLAFGGIVLAAINMFGGFAVTRRMLEKLEQENAVRAP